MSVLASRAGKKANYQPSKHTLLLNAEQPIITRVFLLTVENIEECYCTSNAIMPGFSECVVLHKMSMDHVYREQAHYTESKCKTGSLRLVKSSQIQLIFWLLAKMLQCSVEAKQAPVDNHLLCGGKQGELEQMALVVFCRGCFL